MARNAPLLLTLLVCSFAGQAQEAAVPPDVQTLLKQVIAHQSVVEKRRENYTYLRTVVQREVDKKGAVKKTDSREEQIIFVNTHEVARLVRKNGKELSEGDKRKAQDEVEKQIEKAQRTPPGVSMDGNTISVYRILEIMKVSAPRRESIDGRPMVAFDFVGDPHAKTHGRAEDASKKISGTVWVDQHDLQVRRLTALFADDYKVGFGLFALAKGSSFTFDQKLINNELWLPTSAHIHVVGKAIGFTGYRGEIQIDDRDYQQFHTHAEQHE